MLARHGKRWEALKRYEDVKAAWEAQGFTVSPDITALSTHLEQRTLLAVAPSAYPVESIPGDSEQSTGESCVQHSRRNLIQKLLEASGLTFFSSDVYLDLETLERLSSAVHSSSLIDETTTA